MTHRIQFTQKHFQSSVIARNRSALPDDVPLGGVSVGHRPTLFLLLENRSCSEFFCCVESHIFDVFKSAPNIKSKGDNSCLFLLLILFSAVSMFLFQMLHPWGSGQAPRKSDRTPAANGSGSPVALLATLYCQIFSLGTSKENCEEEREPRTPYHFFEGATDSGSPGSSFDLCGK